MTNTLAIATAPHRTSEKWKQDEITWPELVAWAENPADHKECGNYVLGLLDGKHRNKSSIVNRSGITLDADAADEELWDAVRALRLRAIVHTTYSSTPDDLRLRIIIAVSRAVDPTEYRRITRWLMEKLGVEKFDLGSVQPERFMFKPSAKRGDWYRHEVIAGGPLDVEAALAEAPELPEGDDKMLPEAPDEQIVSDEVISADGEEVYRSYVKTAMGYITAELDELSDLPLKARNSRDQGWDDGVFHKASRLIELSNLAPESYPWDEMKAIFIEHAPQAEAGYDPAVKWADARRKVGNRLRFPPSQKPSASFRPGFNHTSEPSALDLLRAEVGKDGRPLAGMFLRGNQPVHTPRVRERGYVAPDQDDGEPAQVEAVTSALLASRVNHRYDVFKFTGGTKDEPPKRVRAMLRKTTAELALGDTEGLESIRRLNGVTRTPLVRPDGSILADPGYDDATGMLYLPDPGLSVPPVPDTPTRDQVKDAGRLMLDMLEGFPFVTPHDRANYLGAMLTPMLRRVTPPPYKMIAIGAPQRGSGKSLLAELLTTIHGGRFHPGLPKNDDDLRKLITTILRDESAPVVQFDNVTGEVTSPTLAGLITSGWWGDRILGGNNAFSGPNDRLWVLTGNNMQIKGDLPRRTVWTWIDANRPDPERRTGFRIEDLKGWAQRHRGDVTHALLTLVRWWVAVEDMATPESTSSDGYGWWVQALNGILQSAFDPGDEVGTFDHPVTRRVEVEDENEELRTFAVAVEAAWGSSPWVGAEVIAETLEPNPRITVDDLPETAAQKIHLPGPGARLSLGKWLARHEDAPAGSLRIRKGEPRPGTGSNGGKEWWIENLGQ